MLELIDPSILDAAFTELNAANILSKVKGGKDRQGPGRGYQLSDRFITSLSAGFPVGFISHSKSFFQRLTASRPIPYSLSIGRGEMACILNEIPKQRIKLTPLVSLAEHDSLESFEYTFPFSISTSDSKDSKRVITDVDDVFSIDSIDSDYSGDSLDSIKSSESIKEHNMKKRRIYKKKSEINQDAQLTKAQRHLLSLIKQGCMFGYTKTELKKFLESDQCKTFESDLKYLEISFISKVGFDSIRYIDILYLKYWQIQQESCCYKPELWKDISGSTISIFLETALENCVSVIHKNPGIYFSKLVQFLPLSTLEVFNLLEILENKGIIRKTIILKPQLLDLFSLETFDHDCYRLNHDWYRLLS